MLVFLEENVIDYCDSLIPILTAILLEGEEQAEAKKVTLRILKLIGRFVPGKTFIEICMNVSGLKLSDNEDTAVAGLTGFKAILEGYFEALPPNEGLLDKSETIKTLIQKLGDKEYLSRITKEMILPYARLFHSVLESIWTKAQPKELASILNPLEEQIVRICLTSLSVPLYLLSTDTVPEMNFKQIKNSIHQTTQLPTDPDAKYFLGVLSKMREETPYVLTDQINAINSTSVGSGGNDILITESLINYYLLIGNAEGFVDTLGKFETMVMNKETFTKTVLNFNSYLSFYVKENIAEAERGAYLEAITRCMIVCLSYIVKDLYINLYGFRDDDPMEELELPREKIPWLNPVFTAVDLVSINIKKVSDTCIIDLPDERLSDFLIHVCGLMTNEHGKELSTRWLRTLYNFMESSPTVQRHWMRAFKYPIIDSKDYRRLFRNSEEFDNTFMRLLTAIFNTVRSLDLQENYAKFFLQRISILFKVFECEQQTVFKEHDQERTLLYMAEEVVTMLLNHRQQIVVDTLTALIKDLIDRYRFTISNILVEADKKNQPKRLALLKSLWFENVRNSL
jgi:hypothetical protein